VNNAAPVHASIPPAVSVVLAGLIALAAVAVDITLVVLPATTAELGGDAAQSGLIVTAFLAGFAPGQLLWGFLGDRLGRRPTVLAGVGCFVAATIACAMAPTFGSLLAARFAQGLAGAVGPVLGRAVARDFASEIAGARLLALLMAALGTVPLLAPLIGAALLVRSDWRSVFWLTGVVGSTLLVLAIARLPETRAPGVARPAVLGLVGRTRTILRARDFRLGATLVALPFAGYHSIIALYPSIAIDDFRIDEMHFAWLFAAAAACFSLGSAASRWLVARLGLQPLMVTAAALCLAGGSLTAISSARGSLAWLAAGVAVYVFGVGQMLPLATTVALRQARESAAWTAAVLGLVQTIGGVVFSYLATLSGRLSMSLAIILLLCGSGALAVIATYRVDSTARA
jgi:DHA1 family bicyclomycin/chloramphenicol resistance-like MFS transporter